MPHHHRHHHHSSSASPPTHSPRTSLSSINSLSLSRASSNPLHPTRSYPLPDNKRTFTERILSTLFDGPSGTRSSKEARELRRTWEDDKIDRPRTETEMREMRERNRRRGEIAVVGRDYV